ASSAEAHARDLDPSTLARPSRPLSLFDCPFRFLPVAVFHLFCSIRFDDGIQQSRLELRSQNGNIRHYAMASNVAGENVRGKKIHFLYICVYFFEACSVSRREAFHFLCPGN